MWLETKKARNFNAVVWVLGEVNGYADRVLSFLGKAGVVEDPGGDRAVPGQFGQHLLAHRREHSGVAPRGLGDEVMQGLVGCLDMPRIEAGGSMLLRSPGSRPVQ